MVTQALSAPLHAGAEKYYREAGMMEAVSLWHGGCAGAGAALPLRFPLRLDGLIRAGGSSPHLAGKHTRRGRGDLGAEHQPALAHDHGQTASLSFMLPYQA